MAYACASHLAFFAAVAERAEKTERVRGGEVLHRDGDDVARAAESRIGVANFTFALKAVRTQDAV